MRILTLVLLPFGMLTAGCGVTAAQDGTMPATLPEGSAYEVTAPAAGSFGEAVECVAATLEVRGYDVEVYGGEIRGQRERFDGEPVFDVVEVRIGEAEGGAGLHLIAEEMRLAGFGAPTEETRQDAEAVMVVCARE